MAAIDELRQISATLQQFTSSQSKLTEETKRMQQATKEAAEELEVYEHGLDTTNKLTKKQNDLYKKAIDSKQKEIQLSQRISNQNKILADLNERIANTQGNDVALFEQRSKAEDLLRVLQEKHSTAVYNSYTATDNYSKAVQGIRGQLGKLSKITGEVSPHLNKFGFNVSKNTTPITLFGQALQLTIKKMFDYLNTTKQLATANSGVIEGTEYFSSLQSQMWKAFHRGMDPQKFAQITTESRRLINTLGGVDSAFEQTNQTASELYLFTGSIEEARRQALQVANGFATIGIEPSKRALASFTDSIHDQAKINGMSLEQSKALFDGVANDIDSLTILRAARSDEREAILENQRALIINSQALGMTAQQASEAAKMLNKMTAAKPLERLRQAARIRAFGAVMGIGTEAEAAAKELMKPKGQQNQDVIMAFSNLATNVADTAAQQGITTEIFTSTLLDKLNLDQYYGSGSAFSSTLGTVLAKPLDDIRAMYTEGRNSAFSQGQQNIEIAKNQLTAILSGDLLMGEIVNLLDSIRPALGYIFSGVTKIGELTIGTSKLLGNIVGGIFMIPGAIAATIAEIPRYLAGMFGFEGVESTLSSFIHSQIGLTKGFIDGALNAFSKENVVQVSSGSLEQEKANTELLKRNNSLIQKQIEEIVNNNKQSAEINKNTIGVQDQLKNVLPKVQQTNVKPPKLEPIAINDTTKATQEEMSRNLGLVNTNGSKLLDISQVQNLKLDQQISKLNESVGYLKTIAENSPVLVDLAQKQLAAMTMTETQRTRYASNLRGMNNRFAAEYATLM